MKTARLGLCLLLLSTTAALASVPLPPLHPLSGEAGLKLRVTAEIKDATVEEAAEKLSAILGARIRLFDLLTGYSGNYVLDRKRRASLSWKDVPVGRAVRDFGRAYHCFVRPYGDGTYALWPSLPPRGPVHRSGGYQFEVEGAGYTQPTSRMEVTLSVRSEAGDAAAVGHLQRLRIVGEEGQESERFWKAADALQLYPTHHQGDYPDERVVNASIPWPHPAPLRLRVVEGAVQLFRKARRLVVEVPFPAPGEKETRAEAGGMSVHLSGVELRSSQAPRGPGAGFDPGGFRAQIRIGGPPNLAVEVAGQPAFCEAVFADGSPSLVDARLLYPGFGREVLPDEPQPYWSGDLWSKTGPNRRPVKLRIPLIVRSDPGESLPFRIENVSIPPARSPR